MSEENFIWNLETKVNTLRTANKGLAVGTGLLKHKAEFIIWKAPDVLLTLRL